MKRGVITRTRPAVGAHPAPGDVLFFAPPLVVSEAEIDRLVEVARDAVQAVLGADVGASAPRRRPSRPYDHGVRQRCRRYEIGCRDDRLSADRPV